MNILLIGARASGKTTVGRLLSQRIGRPFVDLDERALGQFQQGTVREVWACHGEAAWREAEARALAEALTGSNQIIALGGGTPMITEAKTQLELARSLASVLIIYLICEPDALALRLQSADDDRPSLTGARPEDEIASIVAERGPTYRGLAHVCFDTTHATPVQTAEMIAAFLRAEQPPLADDLSL